MNFDKRYRVGYIGEPVVYRVAKSIDDLQKSLKNGVAKIADKKVFYAGCLFIDKSDFIIYLAIDVVKYSSNCSFNVGDRCWARKEDGIYWMATIESIKIGKALIRFVGPDFKSDLYAVDVADLLPRDFDSFALLCDTKGNSAIVPMKLDFHDFCETYLSKEKWYLSVPLWPCLTTNFNVSNFGDGIEQTAEELKFKWIPEGEYKTIGRFRKALGYGPMNPLEYRELDYCKICKDSGKPASVFNSHKTEECHRFRRCRICTQPHDTVYCPQSGRAQPLCFNCRKPGHIKRDCKELYICWRCRREGHPRNQCPFWYLIPKEARIRAENATREELRPYQRTKSEEIQFQQAEREHMEQFQLFLNNLSR